MFCIFKVCPTDQVLRNPLPWFPGSCITVVQGAATSITTLPINDLDFSIVTICPPKGCNTALYLDLVKAGNGSLSEKVHWMSPPSERRENGIDYKSMREQRATKKSMSSMCSVTQRKPTKISTSFCLAEANTHICVGGPAFTNALQWRRCSSSLVKGGCTKADEFSDEF